MSFALIYLGEHYLSDILVGFAVAALSWWFAHRFTKYWSTRAWARRQTSTMHQQT